MIRYFIYHPIGVCVIALALTILGIVAYRGLPVSLLPDILVPEITVQISYPAASARELQRTIEQPLRNQLMQVNHLDDINSVTQDGLSVLTLRFAYGTNIRLAYLETNEKIDGILSQFPRDLERPKVIKAGAGDIPVFNINVLPRTTYKEDFLGLSEFSETVLKRRIEQLQDVALVDASGLSQPEAIVQVESNKLFSLGLTEQQLSNILKQANLQPGNFSVRDGPYQYNIRFSSVLRTIEDVGNITIAVGGNTQPAVVAQNDPRVNYFANNVLTVPNTQAEAPRRLIALKDIATISVRERPLRGMYGFTGQRTNLESTSTKRGICLAIIKQSDAQLIHLREDLNKLLQQFEKDYPQLLFTLSQDQTELLDLSINNLISNLVTGALLTFLMVFLFMGDWRLPLLVGVVIPISIATTFLGFFLLGLSINIISLAGLVLGMGEIVDSAIIILENIEEKREQGVSLEESCVKGANEVIRPLFTSVLTNSAVFLPLLLLSGIAGSLFFDQAISVSLALGISLLCSYTLVPMLYFLIYRRQTTRKLVTHPTLIMRWLEVAYNATFIAAFRYKWIVILSILILSTGAVWMGIYIEKRGMPNVSRTELEVMIDWNEPLTVAENQRRTSEIIKELNPSPIYSSMFIGQQQFLLNRQLQQAENESLISIKINSQEIYDKLLVSIPTQIKVRFPQAEVDVRPSRNIFEQLFGTNEPVLRLKLYNTKGDQPVDLEVAKKIRNQLTQLNLATNTFSEQNQMSVRLLTDKLLLYEVDDESVIQSLKTVFNNNQITSLQSEQRSIPLLLTGPNIQKDWKNTFVYNRQKQLIPIRSLIEILPRNDYKVLFADKRGTYIPFNFSVNDRSVESIQKEVESKLKNRFGIWTDWSGRHFTDRAYLGELMICITLAIALLFCILTAQFESIQQPMIVLSIICLGLAGAIWSLYIWGNSLNVLSVIGMTVLIGLLDNDSILKIDTMNRSLESMSLLDTIRLAGLRRLKSQVMTFLTTVLGLLPVLLSGGLGSELQQPLAIVVIGGMCVGVVVSWTVIPLLYWWLKRRV